MEKANNAWYQGRYQEAFELQGQVLALAEENAWVLEKVMALNTSGLTWWTLGNHERALRELEKALDTSHTLRARRDETATTLNNMGLVYRDMGEFQKALDTLNQALVIDRDIQSKWAIAYDLKNLGLTYLQMEQPKMALPLFKEALETASNIGNRINESRFSLDMVRPFSCWNNGRRRKSIFKRPSNSPVPWCCAKPSGGRFTAWLASG